MTRNSGNLDNYKQCTFDNSVPKEYHMKEPPQDSDISPQMKLETIYHNSISS